MKRALLMSVLLLAGCGVGGLLAASGGGGGGGGDDANPPPPPVVTVTEPQDPVSNLIAVEYRLEDAQVKGTEGRPGGDDDPRLRVAPQWQVRATADPDTWFDMTPADVVENQGTRGLRLGARRFVWNSLVDLGAFNGEIRVRVVPTYEDTTGIKRKFRIRPAVFPVENRRADTIFGTGREPLLDLETFPVDIRPDGDGFIVASFGANIVERVDALGFPRRLLGIGVPGDNVVALNTPRNPGVARLPTLVHMERDAALNLYTNHSNSIIVTNRMTGATLTFGSLDIPPQTTQYAGNIEVGGFNLISSRGMRFHPSGALLFLNNDPAASTVEAFNPADQPGGPSIVLAGVTIPAGERRVIAGGGGDATTEGVASLTASVGLATAIAVGPDGEVYYVETGIGRIRVLNTGAAPLVVGGVSVAPGTVRTVAGTGVPGVSGEGGPATAAQFSAPTAIEVGPDRSLFVAQPIAGDNSRVRLVNLGATDVTFAETTVSVGNVDRVVGRADGGDGGEGSKARDLRVRFPNALAVDVNGNLLIGDRNDVIFVNGGTATIASYGKTTRAARTSRVYQASLRGGTPLSEPGAVHSNSPNELYFTDRTTIRVMNLTPIARVFGGAAAEAGAVATVGGGSVEGFGGDGGSARSASFARPSGLALEGPRRLYVADTDNDRIRLVNVGDPRVPADIETVLGLTIVPGNVATVIGGPAGPLADDGDGLAPLMASLSGPESVAVGSDGLVYVADTGHHRIRVVNPGGTAVTVAGVPVAPGTIETIVGTGAAGDSADGPGPWAIDSPSALTLDNRNVLYFALRGNHKVRALNLGTAAVTLGEVTIQPGEAGTLVGTGASGNTGDGGTGPDATMISPRGLFVQSRSDNTPVALYVSDEDAHVIRMLNLTQADDLAASLDENNQVLVTSPAAGIITLAGGPNTPGFPNGPSFAGDEEPVAAVRFNRPFGIAVTNRGGQPAHFWVADSGNLRIRRFGAPPLTVTNQ